jgi:sortase A
VSTFRAVVRGTGEVLITLGVVILLFCVYELWWTTVQANAAAEQTTDELHELWENTPPSTAPSDEPVVVKPEDAFAMMRIPRLGSDWYKPIFEGTSRGVLGKGVGHYPESALPGQVGNFSVAGHRTTYGQPFHNLDSLEQGDAVVVETDDRYFVYRITFTEPQIVQPTQVDVIAPVPGQPGEPPTQKLLTMTTCHPKYSAKQRLIQRAELVSERLKTEGPPPELAAAPA